MSMFEIKKKEKITITIYGEQYQIRKMNVSDAKQFGDVDKSLSSQEQIDKSIEFIKSIGTIPEEVLRSMDLEDFSALMEFVVGTVKKK